MADLRSRIPNIRSLKRALGVDYSHLWHVLRGSITPSVRLAKRIEAATNGAIRWTEFFDDRELPLGVPLAGVVHAEHAADAGPLSLGRGVDLVPDDESQQHGDSSLRGVA